MYQPLFLEATMHLFSRHVLSFCTSFNGHNKQNAPCDMSLNSFPSDCFSILLHRKDRSSFDIRCIFLQKDLTKNCVFHKKRALNRCVFYKTTTQSAAASKSRLLEQAAGCEPTIIIVISPTHIGAWGRVFIFSDV